MIDASSPATPVAAASIDLVAVCRAALGAACPVLPGSEPNSVAIRGSLMAVAVANAVRTNNGHAVIFELRGTDAPRFLAAVEVGALPDMVTFSPDGKFILTADEGEPNPSYTIDPPGTLTIIEVDTIGGPRGAEGRLQPLREQRAEQGARALGRAHLRTERQHLAEPRAGANVEKVVGLGLKDHSLPGNALDTNDQDNAIHIVIAALPLNGHPYLILANEGDAREYAAYVEALRLGNAVVGHARALSASLDGTRTLFNTTNTANSRDNRSDDKGIEPESVVVGDVAGRLYAFVGLERDRGIVVLDVSDPGAPQLRHVCLEPQVPAQSEHERAPGVQ